MNMHRDLANVQDVPQTGTAEAATALCDRLMQSTGDLVTLLERETGLLRRGKPHEITALQARKSALGALLTRDMALFRRDAAFIRTAVPERLHAIKEQHLQLQNSLTANQDALSAMKAISESMLHTIAAKLDESISGPEIYGKNAGMIGKPAGRTSAISFDETL